MYYTLTKFLTADYFRDNPFTKAFLELVDEVIFCCYMESREILSQLSFEDMDDDFFLQYQNFFLDGLSTYNIDELDKLTLSQWFSLLHVRGQLQDLNKLLKFGGSLKQTQQLNDFQIYNNADVPETITTETKDGIIYTVTDKNINLDNDFFINQQTPAGYKLGLIKITPPFIVKSDDLVQLIKESDRLIRCIDSSTINVIKEKQADFTFYRRRQFDQYYTFKHLFQSSYTINNLSQFHQNGTYFNGFDIQILSTHPTIINETENVYSGTIGDNALAFVDNGGLQIIYPGFLISGTFQNDLDFVTLEQIDAVNGNITYNGINRSNNELYNNSTQYPDEGWIQYNEPQQFPIVYTYSNSGTLRTIAPDEGFDTGLSYNANNLYSIETDDGQGNVTMFGWEAGVEPAPSYGEDTSTGSISAVTLPTEHSGSYVEAQFDSLRYYAKAVISDVEDVNNYYFGSFQEWFSATLTWTDSSIGDLSDKIVVSDKSCSTINVQTVLYILFITSGIIGYAANEYYPIESYSYNNGVHSIRFYSYGTGDWYNRADAGRIQIRYLDGTTSFENLSAFDLVSVSSGTLSKDTTTDRYAMYNAWGGNITVKAKYLE